MSYCCLDHERTIFHSYMQRVSGVCMKPGVGPRYILGIFFLIAVIQYLTRQLKEERYFLAHSSGTSVYGWWERHGYKRLQKAEAYGNCLLPVTDQEVRRNEKYAQAMQSQGPPQRPTSCSWAPLTSYWFLQDLSKRRHLLGLKYLNTVQLVFKALQMLWSMAPTET